MGGDRDDSDYGSFMSRHFPDAIRLKQHKQAPRSGHRKNPARRQRLEAAADDYPALRIPGISSEVAAETELSYRTDGIQKRIMLRLKRGQIPYQARLDMHGLNVEQAHESINHFLIDARQNNYYCVLIIHGQGYRSASGIPVLKQNTDFWLRRHNDVLAFHSATPRDGGKGAVYVLLRRGKQN